MRDCGPKLQLSLGLIQEDGWDMETSGTLSVPQGCPLPLLDAKGLSVLILKIGLWLWATQVGLTSPGEADPIN